MSKSRRDNSGDGLDGASKHAVDDRLGNGVDDALGSELRDALGHRLDGTSGSELCDALGHRLDEKFDETFEIGFDEAMRRMFHEADKLSPAAPPEGLHTQLLAMADLEATRIQRRWRRLGVGLSVGLGILVVCFIIASVVWSGMGSISGGSTAEFVGAWFSLIAIKSASLTIALSAWMSQLMWTMQAGVVSARWLATPLLIASTWCACGLAVAAILSGRSGWRKPRWR